MKLQNDLLLRTAKGETTERPPVWLMRQAGRILPQYRALRAKLSGFKELVETPHLAAEVTIQPVDELQVDAAIIFSDILVIPEAMGLPYELVEKQGPRFPTTIHNLQDVERLITGADAASELRYVYDALAYTKKELNGRVPLIGFAGAPWTLLAYMVEGKGSKTFSLARRFLYQQPKAAHLLLEKISRATLAYLKQKVSHGADIVQVFDSWAAMLTPEQYRTFALPYLKYIVEGMEGKVPVIIFAKGANFALEELDELPCQVLGLDWTISPEQARVRIGQDRVFQGNFDPCALYASPEDIQQGAISMIRAFNGHHIVNLGHGVYPDTPLEGVRAFVNAVKTFRY